MEEQAKRYWVDHEGNIYGPFSAQDDGFPCAGEVVQFYRKLMKMSVKDFAAILKVTSRRVQIMEKNNIVPDSMERRRFIAKSLQIPPLLLGLASVESFLRPAENAETKSISSVNRVAVDQKTITQYQSQLTWFWSLHYTSSANNVMPQVQTDINHLRTLIAYSPGKDQEKLVEQLCSFYELAARVESDRTNSVGALQYLNAAIELAQPLNNMELYGRLLYKRGLILYETRDFPKAIVDLEQANQLQLTSPLAGSILLELGIVKSYLIQSTSLTDRRTVLGLFDQAERHTRLSQPQTDASMGVRYDSGRYLTGRGEGLINLNRRGEAEETLDVAEQNTSPDLTRRQLFIDLQKVKLYVQGKDYPIGVALARDAVSKAKAIGSSYSVKSLEEIIAPIFGSSYSQSDDMVELVQIIGKTKKKLL